MPTDPEEGPPPRSLAEVPLPELIERARGVADNTSLMETRGALVVALRAHELSWREIETRTGIPQASARRWAKKYLSRPET
jgi:hypothetical protein